MTLRSEEELEVLRMIRNGEYRSVTVYMKDGRIQKAEGAVEHDIRERDAIVDLLESEDFQTVSVTRVDGKIIRVTQQKPVVFRKRSGAAE
jgi:hypothetical protein